jgi:hypothetical protein
MDGVQFNGHAPSPGFASVKKELDFFSMLAE